MTVSRVMVQIQRDDSKPLGQKYTLVVSPSIRQMLLRKRIRVTPWLCGKCEAFTIGSGIRLFARIDITCTAHAHVLGKEGVPANG